MGNIILHLFIIFNLVKSNEECYSFTYLSYLFYTNLKMFFKKKRMYFRSRNFKK